MRIIKVNKIGIQQAIKILKSGGVIVYPTDTAYALGGVFNSPQVNKKILKIKRRNDTKFTIIAANFSQVKIFFKLNCLEEKLAKKFWPGPLSIVVSRKFAVRVPKNKTAQTLAQLVGKPLIATSANISGKKTLYDSLEILKQFKNKKNQPALILDSGKLTRRKTSTIIKVKNNKIEILRAGAIKIKD